MPTSLLWKRSNHLLLSIQSIVSIPVHPGSHPNSAAFSFFFSLQIALHITCASHVCFVEMYFSLNLQIYPPQEISVLVTSKLVCWSGVPQSSVLGPLLLNKYKLVLVQSLLFKLLKESYTLNFSKSFLLMLSSLKVTFILIIFLLYKDLLVSAALTFLWLASSSAWAKGVSNVWWATSPANIVTFLDVCKNSMNKCTAGTTPYMGRLNASVVSCLCICLF